MRQRLDQLLVQRGIFASREQARRAVMAGQVRVDGRAVDKPGTQVPTEALLESTGRPEPFVSRAGRKLAAALDHFGLDPEGWTCVDVGASTGGFTDCLLQRGARCVFAIDVGHGQLDYTLRADPRVVVMERLNARHLPADALGGVRCDLATFDLAFISALKVVPAVLPHLRPGGLLLPLLKPQFEAARKQVGKGGIIRDEALRRRVVEGCVAELLALGLEGLGSFDSPVAGAEGNRESFCLLRIPGR